MNHLCKFKQLFWTAEVIVEICGECKRKVYYTKDKQGRIDNKQYAKDHQRDLLQPNNPLYKKYYGN